MAKDADHLEQGWRQRGWPAFVALLAVAALMPWPLLVTHDSWWAFILVTAERLLWRRCACCWGGNGQVARNSICHRRMFGWP